MSVETYLNAKDQSKLHFTKERKKSEMRHQFQTANCEATFIKYRDIWSKEKIESGYIVNFLAYAFQIFLQRE